MIGIERLRERKWQVVAMLFLAGGLNYVDRTSIAAVFPLIKADLHATDVELGAIGSMFLWSYAAGAPFAGMLNLSELSFWRETRRGWYRSTMPESFRLLHRTDLAT